MRSFDTETTLSDGALAYATCKAPWRSARISAAAHRFTLLAHDRAAGPRRAEGEAALGERCQDRARRRIALAVVLLGGGAALAWVGRPERMRR